MVDNKRVDLLPKIIEGYSSYYKILTKEEAITIISAEPLNSNQESQVEEALKKSHPGVNFTLKFEVNSGFVIGLASISIKQNIAFFKRNLGKIEHYDKLKYRSLVTHIKI